MSDSSQQFVRDLDRKLWSAADRLRANLDDAVYKHAVLGLIFLKYVSDSFAMRQREIERQLRDPASDYFFDSAGKRAEIRRKNDEGRKRFKGTNEALCAAYYPTVWNAAKDHGSAGAWKVTAPIRNLRGGKLPRSALRTEQTGIHRKMWRFTAGDRRERLLAGTSGRERNRLCRQAAATEERVRRADSNPRHNQARSQFRLSLHPSSFILLTFSSIRGIDFNFGKELANSFTSEQHPALRADYVMVNPPFNINEWWDAKLEDDPRWRYGTPPRGNANFAWIQHMLHHLAPQGSMALLLANGSRSSCSGGEGQIRQALIEADLVECMVALPGQLFTNTQIPACIWFLTKSKKAHGASRTGDDEDRNRTGQILFIDVRKLRYMIDRVLRAFTAEDLEKITGTFHKWKRSAADYADLPGFCKSATLEEIAAHGFVLTPGRYVGMEDVEDKPFEEKMACGYFAESVTLEQTTRAHLKGLCYGR